METFRDAWFKTSEKLPKDGVEVLAHWKNGWVVTKYNSLFHCFEQNFRIEDVDKWAYIDSLEKCGNTCNYVNILLSDLRIIKFGDFDSNTMVAKGVEIMPGKFLTLNKIKNERGENEIDWNKCYEYVESHKPQRLMSIEEIRIMIDNCEVINNIILKTSGDFIALDNTYWSDEDYEYSKAYAVNGFTKEAYIFDKFQTIDNKYLHCRTIIDTDKIWE